MAKKSGRRTSSSRRKTSVKRVSKKRSTKSPVGHMKVSKYVVPVRKSRKSRKSRKVRKVRKSRKVKKVRKSRNNKKGGAYSFNLNDNIGGLARVESYSVCNDK